MGEPWMRMPTRFYRTAVIRTMLSWMRRDSCCLRDLPNQAIWGRERDMILVCPGSAVLCFCRYCCPDSGWLFHGSNQGMKVSLVFGNNITQTGLKAVDMWQNHDYHVKRICWKCSLHPSRYRSDF